MKAVLVALLLVFNFAFAQNYSTADSNLWHFGNYLKAGDEFDFEICDYAFKVSGSPCYNVLLKFVALLPNNGDHIWVVSAHIEDQIPTDAILHISQSTKKISTNIANKAYADSLSRTLGWINQFASQNKPQMLGVGKVWGYVNSDSKPIELIVSSMELVDGVKTYTIQYTNIKQSYLIIREGFPFPIFAQIYKPVSSHQDIPKEFTLKIKNTGQDGSEFLLIDGGASENQKQHAPDLNLYEFNQNEVFGNFTVEQILNQTFGKNYTNYFDQAVGNFTKFLELISRMLENNATAN